MSSDAALTVKSPTWTVMMVELVTVGLPPEPFSVTAYTPPVEELSEHVAVAVPPEATVALVQDETVTPAGLDEPVNETVPLNPCRLVTVMVVEPVAPLLKLLPVADREKPAGTPKVKTAFAEWEAVPKPVAAVLVTTTVNVPEVDDVHVRVVVEDVLFAVKDTLVALNAPQERPEGTTSLRFTVPAQF